MNVNDDTIAMLVVLGLPAVVVVTFVLAVQGRAWRSMGWPVVLSGLDFYATRNGWTGLSRRIRTRLPPVFLELNLGVLAYRRGDMAEALGRVERAGPAAMDNMYSWNLAMNILIAAGRYREALAGLGQPWRRLVNDDSGFWRTTLASVQMNEAEAMMNLGDSERAARHVTIWPGHPVWPQTASFLAVHATWMHAVRGELEHARGAYEAVGVLDPDYRSEAYYASAFVNLAAGDLASAAKDVHQGLKAARRASSERNGLFLLATVARRRGDVEEALSLFQQGAEHRYQGQGGSALLEWGDLCAALARHEDARRAWAWAVERDPQSSAAITARDRLGAGEHIAGG